MSNRFQPILDQVLVKRSEEKSNHASAIIIPDTAKQPPVEGVVVAAGAGDRRQDGSLAPLSVKAGDYILFGRYSGQEIQIDGEEFLVMKEQEIVGIVEVVA